MCFASCAGEEVMPIKLWRWLRKLSEEKIRKFRPPHADYKCPNCNTWSKVVVPKTVSYTENGYDIECGQCEAITAWHALGPSAIPMSTTRNHILQAYDGKEWRDVRLEKEE